MNNFYPGPSKLYPQVKAWMSEIYDSEILSKNHRSEAFMELWRDTVTNLKASLSIPADYEVYVTSSATECWEIVNQSLVSGNTAYVYNGAFGQKWANYALKNKSFLRREALNITEVEFGLNDQPPIKTLRTVDTICLTHNETSNGTCLPNEDLCEIRNQNPDALIAVDATSSMAGVALPWKSGDVWFASVQKCFGLPSGLAVLVVSQKAIERAQIVNDRSYYNSLLNIRANFLKNQTPYTPNILGISLLNKQVQFVEKIAVIDERIKTRANSFYNFIENETSYDLLVKTSDYRSPTVIAIRSKNVEVEQIIANLFNQGITLGKGYGEWKNDTFRIANFPAITDSEFEYLKAALR